MNDETPAATLTLQDLREVLVEPLAQVAASISSLNQRLADETRRKGRLQNWLLSVLIVLVVGIAGWLVWRAGVQDDRVKEQTAFIEEVNQGTKETLIELVTQLQNTDDPERIKMSDLIPIVCDIEPVLCDANGNYVGR